MGSLDEADQENVRNMAERIRIKEKYELLAESVWENMEDVYRAGYASVEDIRRDAGKLGIPESFFQNILSRDSSDDDEEPDDDFFEDMVEFLEK